MCDWRINKEQEKFYKGITLLKIVFPGFWLEAYKKKNNFFYYVLEEAKQHVDKIGISNEYLEGDRPKELWHRHCDFCTKKISIEMQEECYCTKDCFNWICAECFNDFKKRFNWKINEVKDISEENIITLKVILK